MNTDNTVADVQCTTDQPEALMYFQNPAIADEVFSADGEIKPHWSYLMQSLCAMNQDTLNERSIKIQALLRNDGATYNPHETADHANRAWRLDPIPHLINSEDWAKIEHGLLERTELFNLLLKDIYNERTIIRQGIIPPEALFTHRGFLRPCQGIQMPGEQSLILHDVDMIRNADGDMVVISDNTQNPNGAGYALENRTVLSRVFPSLFRDSHVHRLASFFQRLRKKLLSLASADDDNSVVILSPGPHDASYFEHAYLANYMGFTLVQSTDLIVRSGFLWMKSLEGLKRVDVLFRRIDDMFCDPVELKSDSLLGVAGLLEVARNGNVTIANPVGCGILENPVLYKYLPEISKHFLGRELRLPTVPTYWCKDPDDMAWITNNFDNLVIKPIMPNRNFSGIMCANLSDNEKVDLLQRIKAKPYRYVAQEQVFAQQVPCFIDNSLQSRPSTLRSFAIASESSYIIMPGALSQICKEPDTKFLNVQSGAFSKDTWIIATESIPEPEADKSAEVSTDFSALQLVSLPSRVVENLFWMGRYAERAEAGLRLVRTLFTLMNSEEGIEENAKQRLIKAIIEVTASFSESVDSRFDYLNNPDLELRHILNDGTRTGSIRATINAMLYASDKSKELLSLDTIRVTNNIRDSLMNMDNTLSNPTFPVSDIALDPLITDLLALSGLLNEGIHNIGWRFTELGKRLERSLQTASLIKVLLTRVVPAKEQETLLKALLLSLELLITYRRRYRTQNDLKSSLDLVVLDTSNPRSLVYQLTMLSDHIEQLPKAEQLTQELTTEERIILEGISHIKLSHLAKLVHTETTERENLTRFLTQLQYLMNTLGNVISDKYFDHSLYPQQLVDSEWRE